LIRDKRFYTYFFSMVIPMALQNIVVFSVNLADNVMIGGYAELSISAVAVANQIQFVLQMLTMGISEGMVVLSAQYWGQKRLKEMKSIIGVGMKMQVILSFVFFFIIFFFPAQVSRIITPDADVIAESVQYLQIMCFTYFTYCMTNLLLSAMRCVESVRVGFVVTLSALVINIIFNYILIYGHFGAPRMGVRGAALATLISRLVEFAIAVVYILRIDKKLKLRFKEMFAPDFTFFMDYIKSGLPVILSNFIWSLGTGAQVAILGRLGAQALAANGIAGTLFQMFSVACGALSGVSAIVIGKTVGEGDFEKVRQYAHTLQVIYLILGVLSGLGLFASKGLLLRIYNIAPETYALANGFLTVLSFTLMGTTYQVPCLTGIVRGGGDTKFVLINDTIFLWLIVIPSSAIAAFVFGWHPVVVYIFLKCDQVLKCFVAIVKVNRFKWIRVLTR
jgi:putative MATE family efflux protein